MEKEIIGYVLTKPEYKDALFTLCVNANHRPFLHKTYDKWFVRIANKDDFEGDNITNLEKAGVLNLWLAPVYKKTWYINKSLDSGHELFNIDSVRYSTAVASVELTEEQIKILGL